MSGKLHTALFIAALCACSFMARGQVVGVTVYDTLLNHPTRIEIADSLRMNDIHPGDERLYDSIESIAGRRRVPHLLFDTFFVKPGGEDEGNLVDEAGSLARFNGKTIGQITIERRNVFEGGRSWVQRTANSTHALTREKTVEKELLFKSGDALDADMLVTNNRLLKSRSYIFDSRIEVSADPADTSVVNVRIVTTDSWTIGLDLATWQQRRATANLFDANFAGSGNRLGIGTNFGWSDGSYGGNTADYHIPNLLGTFYTANIGTGRNFEDSYLGMSVDKEFILPTDYGAGASFAEEKQGRYRIHTIDSTYRARVDLRTFDLWGGKSFHIAALDQNVYFTGRYDGARFTARPGATAGLNRALHDYDLVLLAAGLYREKFYSTSMLYGYGYREYVASGQKIELTGGYSWGEFRNDLYMGVTARKGGFVPFGFLTAGFTLGSYVRPAFDSWVGTALDVNVHWFSNLYALGSSRLRHFVTLKYTHGWNRGHGEGAALWFTREHTPQSFNRYVTGYNRALLNTETVIFTPLEPVGFRVALFGFIDAALIGRRHNPLRNDFYSTFGLGVRLKNERLVFNAIEFRLGLAVGRNGFLRNNTFDISSEQHVAPYRFLPSRPETVAYR